jgi:UDP-perosamine 4-acetyltransferase
MTLPVIILGSGGHARVLLEVLQRTGRTIVGFTDANRDRWKTQYRDVTVLGDDDIVSSYSPMAVELVNGIGNRARRGDSDLAGRQRLYQDFRGRGFRFPPVTSHGSILAADVVLGDGVQVMAGTVVQPGCTIGDNTIVNTSASVDHDCRIGAHCHVAPGAVLCGGVVIGVNVHVGAGATVLPGVQIGDGAVVAAGATIVKDVAACTTAGMGRHV